MAETAVLERVPVSTVALGEQHDDMVELAHDLQHSMGYAALKNGVGSVGSIFSQLEIAPFSLRSVQRYKASKAGPVYPSLWVNMCRHLWLAAFFAFCASVMSLFTNLFIGASWTHFFITALSVIGCFVLGVISLAISEKYSKVPVRRWEQVSLHNFGQPVPMYVLQTADAIKKRFPEAYVYVEYLVEDDYVTLDPFLVVQINEMDYYVEVWDEPDFNAKRVY